MSNTLLERTAAAKQLLTELVLENDCRVDRFDASYLEDLPLILNEMYDISTLAGDTPIHRKVQELARLAGLPDDAPVNALPDALRAIGITDEEFRPASQVSEQDANRFYYNKAESWDEVKNTTAKDGAQAIEKIKKFHEQYSRKWEKKILGIIPTNTEREFTDLGRPIIGDPWTPLFQQFIRDGLVKADEPVLTLGPRWAGEIKYFRNTIGFKNAIGLDLFSHDKNLVKEGDMHAMPFADNTFGLIYQRNTFDKSYDIRKALSECVRVLRNGGILVSDDTYGSTEGLNAADRTSIKRNIWILRYLRDHVDTVLYEAETPPEQGKGFSFELIGQLAVKIRK